MRYQVERQGFAEDAPVAVVDMYRHWCGGHVVKRRSVKMYKLRKNTQTF